MHMSALTQTGCSLHSPSPLVGVQGQQLHPRFGATDWTVEARAHRAYLVLSWHLGHCQLLSGPGTQRALRALRVSRADGQ